MAQSITAPRLLEHDPSTGVTEWFHSNADGTEFTIERVENVTGLIETNKALANDDHGQWGDGQLVASFPMSVWWDLKQRGILDDPKAYRRWLNDADNKVWRIRPGKV